jgi:hypothetical protein
MGVSDTRGWAISRGAVCLHTPDQCNFSILHARHRAHRTGASLWAPGGVGMVARPQPGIRQLGSRPSLRAAPIVVVGDRRAVRLGMSARAFGVNAMEVSAGQQSTSKDLRLRAMLRRLNPGRETFICPDAPDGPADEPKRGVYMVARHSNALVLPFGIWASPARQMRRWDSNLLPYPFARMTAVVGEPHDFNQVSSERDFQARLKDNLTAVREEGPWPAPSFASQDHRNICLVFSFDAVVRAKHRGPVKGLADRCKAAGHKG